MKIKMILPALTEAKTPYWVAYPVVGLSLREVEKSYSSIAKTIFISWILCICVVLVGW